jgi:uncharacterized protein (TIGR02145 family)
MKKTLILVTLLLVSIKIIAQVGIGTTTPDPNAVLDIVSTDKGFLPPRVANVAAIATPVAGLMIYDESNQCMRYYNGTIWSDCMGNITPASPCGTATTMTDIDGNTYPIVAIDDKCWMAADLKTSRYPNGDAIPYIDDNATWVALADNNTDDAYSFYGDSDNDGNVDIAYPDYGALYSYSAAIGDNWSRDNSATNSEGGQGICPDGWHLPTDAEWTTLTTFLGGTSVAGGKMKEAGTTHWHSPNTDATNSSGFTALPSGDRNSDDGTFYNIGYYGYWWGGTEGSSSNAYLRQLNYNNANANRLNVNKSFGFCVRCIRD